MDEILSGQVLVNGIDIWKEYGVFLTEDKKGDMANLTAILHQARQRMKRQ